MSSTPTHPAATALDTPPAPPGWLTRGYLAIRAVVNSPRRLVTLIVALWVACSMAYALIEGKGPIESLWWGVVTGTTVGYGDTYPDSTAGRGVAVVLILTMIVFIPIAIGHVIAGLVLDRNEFTHDEQVALARTLESLHNHLGQVEHLVVANLLETRGAAWVQEQVDAYRREEDSRIDVHEQMLDTFGCREQRAEQRAE